MTDLNTLSIATLANIYNQLVPMAATADMPLAQIKKFSDKASGVKRVTAVLGDINTARESADQLPLIVTPEGALVELPESGAPSTGSAEVDTLRDSGALDARVADEKIEDLVAAGSDVVEGSTEGTTESSDVSEGSETSPEGVAEEPQPPKIDISITKRASAPPKPAPRAKPKQNPGGRPALVGLTDIIALLHTEGNPKRAEAARRFAKYKDGMSVQDYVDAVGNKRQALRDVAWDMKMKWISISGATKTKKTAEVPAEAVEESAATGAVAEDAAPTANSAEDAAPTVEQTEETSVTSQAA